MNHWGDDEGYNSADVIIKWDMTQEFCWSGYRSIHIPSDIATDTWLENQKHIVFQALRRSIQVALASHFDPHFNGQNAANIGAIYPLVLSK